MKLVKNKKYILSIILIALLTLSFILIMPTSEAAFAANSLADGKYIVPIDNDLPMGKNNFKDSVIVEKLNGHYYMTFTVLDSTAVKNIKLNISSDEIGTVITQNGKEENYIFSLSKNTLESTINVSGFVTGMKTNIDFNIKLRLNEATKVADSIDNPENDRPAIFIPTLSKEISSSEVEKGSYYFVPEITAKINGLNIPVEIKAYYINQGNKEELEIVDNKFKFDYIGEYHLIIRAESDKYKTLKGKNTFVEQDVKIMSKIGATSIAKLDKENSSLKEDITIQANYVKSGDMYDKAQSAMEKISDHYEVINIELFDALGNKVTSSSEISLLIRANDAYNRSNVLVYKLNEDGSINEISNENYGRYLKINTDEVGTFIVCAPGVEFVMPMWAIATITVVSIVLVIAIIIIIIVVYKKKQKKNKINTQ